MNESSLHPLPVTPRCPVVVRAATAGDQGFIDALQKMHRHMVGWMPAAQVEGKIKANQVLVGEDGAGNAVGYCIAQDQYMGRDDVGIIYHLNMLPLRQRHLIGASLIKAVFERAAYGCRLFSCWCAQDIRANFFWEALGFVPLAFRTGSRSMQRIHIFWQRRIRADDTVTPYWFPSQTKAGAIREDRLVLPIPIGTHWRDVMPIVLPGMQAEPEIPKTLPGGMPVRPRPEQPKVTTPQRLQIIRSQSKHLKGVPAGKAAVIVGGRIRYVERADFVPEAEPPKPKRPRKPAAKNDPKLITAARELRDRFLEHINTAPLLSKGKYAVARALPVPQPPASTSPLRLPAAA
jgi:GNAT superfamily N-acetyltransferase